MDFKIGDRVKLKDNYYLEKYRGATGKIIEFRTLDVIVQLDKKYKGWDFENYHNCLYVFGYEMDKIKNTKIKRYTLQRASKEAEKEEFERFMLDECIKSMWQTFNFVNKPKFNKKEKQMIQEINEISSKYRKEV